MSVQNVRHFLTLDLSKKMSRLGLEMLRNQNNVLLEGCVKSDKRNKILDRQTNFPLYIEIRPVHVQKWFVQIFCKCVSVPCHTNHAT
jgi:hypothetical protein